MTRHTRNPHFDVTSRDVFVYGTLRQGEINDIALAAARYGRPDIPAPVYIGTGHVPGRLVDFGSWPGLLLPAVRPPDVDPLPSSAPLVGDPMVIGDVFRIDVALLPILDEIEGIRPDGARDAFYRSEVEVVFAGPGRAEGRDGAPLERAMTQGEEDKADAATHWISAGDPRNRVGLRCYFYPIDDAAGRGLPPIPGGDWIAYRQSRNG